MSQLKSRNNLDRLIHRDSSDQTWEQKFDAYLVPRIGHRPSDRPARDGAVRRVPIEEVRRFQPKVFTPDTWSFFAQSHGLRVEDNRSRQGALWVLGAEQPSHVAEQLAAWGFRCRQPRGWFRE